MACRPESRSLFGGCAAGLAAGITSLAVAGAIGCSLPAANRSQDDAGALQGAINAYSAAQSRTLANIIDSGIPTDDVEREDALRLAEGMITLSGRILQSDPDAPAFALMEDGRTRTGLANPDNDHWLARIRGDRRYRIRGTRGRSADLSIQTFRTFVGSSQGVDEINADELDIAADGSFELWLGPGRGPDQGSNAWLRTDPKTRWVLIRDSHEDWRELGGRFSIERLGASDPDPGPSPTLRERLLEASENLDASSRFWPALSRSVLDQLTPNRVMPPRQGVGNLARQWTSMSLFTLEDDEALVIAVAPSSAAYQGLQLGSVLFDAFDPHRQTSLSRAQSNLGSDGLLRYVVSARDPGVPNWIDTAGHRRGFLLLRWQGLDDLPPSHLPEGHVVASDFVLTEFPSDVQRVSEDERQLNLANRVRELQRRRSRTR